MPLCFVFTNLKDDEIAPDFEDKLQNCIAEIFNKPLERISVVVHSGMRMNFNGKKQPGLICQIHSIAVFDEERNKNYFPEFFKVLTAASNLPASSVIVEFQDLPAHMVMSGSSLPSS